MCVSCTCVALEFLHDLLCLQVPDINHVVLGAWHDPLQESSHLALQLWVTFSCITSVISKSFKYLKYSNCAGEASDTRRRFIKNNKTQSYPACYKHRLLTLTRAHVETRVLTFPPVTEKFANMQYFSFLWPVYVFKHWNVGRTTTS